MPHKNPTQIKSSSRRTHRYHIALFTSPQVNKQNPRAKYVSSSGYHRVQAVGPFNRTNLIRVPKARHCKCVADHDSASEREKRETERERERGNWFFMPSQPRRDASGRHNRYIKSKNLIHYLQHLRYKRHINTHSLIHREREREERGERRERERESVMHVCVCLCMQEG